ncbi:hypothetical protein N7462_011585 [Penicillium macrosclerotiorum]|uniref:uncharacterized protein n=1 Tax=Penicillium macrosclerotiorum TaxID=303699 RepID=UPI0025487F37|nr:uncharacterized protein N7462_011585 [Penicillium macrosclerotiorum]KAJ5662659.1 hypothetical protein N7462_011585 [Penicillium macrosclerotiorum]
MSTKQRQRRKSLAVELTANYFISTAVKLRDAFPDSPIQRYGHILFYSGASTNLSFAAPS